MGGIFSRDCYYSKLFPIEACIALNLLLKKWMSLTSDDKKSFISSHFLKIFLVIESSCSQPQVGPAFYEVLTYFIATTCVCCCGTNNLDFMCM